MIGAAESDVNCPVIEDPVRTMHIDGTPIDAGVISPLADAEHRILRSVLLPLAIAVAVVFVLAAVRWLITGVFKGVGAVVRTAANRARCGQRPAPGRGSSSPNPSVPEHASVSCGTAPRPLR